MYSSLRIHWCNWHLNRWFYCKVIAYSMHSTGEVLVRDKMLFCGTMILKQLFLYKNYVDTWYHHAISRHFHWQLECLLKGLLSVDLTAILLSSWESVHVLASIATCKAGWSCEQASTNTVMNIGNQWWSEWTKRYALQRHMQDSYGHHFSAKESDNLKNHYTWKSVEHIFDHNLKEQ